MVFGNIRLARTGTKTHNDAAIKRLLKFRKYEDTGNKPRRGDRMQA